jgi:hypothetical protein
MGRQNREAVGDWTGTGVVLIWLQIASSSVQVPGVAVAFGVEQLETRHLVTCQLILAGQKRVEFRWESANLHGLFVCVDRLPPTIRGVSFATVCWS